MFTYGVLGQELNICQSAESFETYHEQSNVVYTIHRYTIQNK